MKNPAISYRVLRAEIKPCGHRMDKIYLVPIPLLILALSACASTPIIKIQYVNVPQFLPYPATLTAPVEVNLLPGTTYGEALGSLREGLTSCDGKLGAIAILKPPNPPF